MSKKTCSILLRLYHGDTPEYLSECLDSIINQTVKPSEIIIVVDGPIPTKLKTIVGQYAKKYKKITPLFLPKNLGTGGATNAGLKIAKNELVALMDADDVAIKNRIELQLTAFENTKNLDILGGQIEEFEDNTKNIQSKKIVPTTEQSIKKFARRRCPMNHPTVMYKKTAILNLGGYDQNLRRSEDYDLWLRALNNKLHIKNLSETLILFRTDRNAIKRRKTFKAIKEQIAVRKSFYRNHYIGFFDYIISASAQLILFLIPTPLAKFIYKAVLRK